jgi:putative oxidoreductase
MNQLIDVGAKVGRYIYCIPLLAFAMNHFTNAQMMAGMVPIPGGVFWVYFTGAALAAGAIGIITNLKGLGALAAFLTGLLILSFVFTIHLPGFLNAKDEMSKMLPMIAMLKDLGMVGGAWAIAAVLKK